MKKIIAYVLILFFFGHLLLRIGGYWKEYTTKFDANYWKVRYQESQWVNPKSKNPIGDDGLFAYAGWEYFRGANPTYYVAGYPPLGLYLIGLSIFLFQNQNIFALIVGLLVLGIYYLLNVELFKNRFVAFIPVFLFSLEPIFIEQLRAPYLDLLHLLFLLLTFLFFTKKKYTVSSIFLGCFISTKFAFLGILPVLSIICFLLLKKKRTDLLDYILSLPAAGFVYLFVYTRYFLLGNSFLSFLGIHKWIIHYYEIGAKGVFGAVFPMIFSGVWYTWFSGPQRVQEWEITWTIIFSTAFVYGIFFVKNLFKKKSIDSFALIFIWIIFYLMFLSVTPVFPRYLLLLLPFLYNLSIWFLYKNFYKLSIEHKHE